VDSFTILVVDDDAVIRRLLTTVLRSKGFATLEAADGRAGVAAYRANRLSVGLILLDVRLGGDLDGPETLRQLKQLDPGVRCCFMSGDPGPHSVQDLLALGAVEFLPKPFRLADVVRVAREAVDAAGAERPLPHLPAVANPPAGAAC
jgi:CheY-like chemotaxis protein